MGRVSATVVLVAASLGQLGCEPDCRGLHNLTPGPCRKYTESGGGGAAVPDVVASGGQPTDGGGGLPPPLETVTTVHASPGYGLARIAPEQYSADVLAALNFGEELRNSDNDSGQTLDHLLLAYGVPLGGVDFVTASRRDPTTKGQTVLVARLLAWELARAAVWKEHETAEGARRVFTKCNMKTDRPDQGGDQELRFFLQVEELFLRFYARPPTDAEKAAVKTAFVTALHKELYPPKAWIMVLYALLSSQEFWHT